MGVVDQGKRELTPAGAGSSEASSADKRRPTRGTHPNIEAFPRIVTVSREFGAGGARISGRVAAELGFQLWDHELIAHLSRRAAADPSVVREIDERERDLLDEMLSSSLHGGRLSGSKYRALLTRTVVELAERGGAVIVGRGANFLVDPEQSLRVRVVCPLNQRIDRYARSGRVDRDRAERYVRSKDRERQRFVDQLCGEDANDPTHYDLVVNTYDLSEEAASSLIVSTYHALWQSAARAQQRDARVAAQSLT
jgi:hypothetical protein